MDDRKGNDNEDFESMEFSDDYVDLSGEIIGDPSNIPFKEHEHKERKWNEEKAELEKRLKAEEHKVRDMEDSLRKANETIEQKNAVLKAEEHKVRDMEDSLRKANEIIEQKNAVLKAEEHKVRDMEDSLKKANERIVQKSEVEVLEYDIKNRDLENKNSELQRRSNPGAQVQHNSTQMTEEGKLEESSRVVVQLECENQILKTLVSDLHKYVTSHTEINDNIFQLPSTIRSDPSVSSLYQQALDIYNKFKEIEREVLEYDNRKRDLENENAELQRRECEKLRKTVKEQNESPYSLAKHDEDMLKLNTAWQNSYKQLEQDTERKIYQSTNDWDKYCQTLIQQHTKEKEHLLNSVETLKSEKDNLLTRLSKIAADRLTHENVNIVDLSDADRPTKLQEVYSELYDNVWTDAFEELTEQQRVSEKDAIKMLLNILMSSFQKCREITWGRYERLKYVASSVDIVERNSLSSVEKVMSDVSEPRLVKQESESRAQFGNKNAKEDQRLECTINLSIDLEKQIKDIWRKTTVALKENSIEQLSSVIETCLGIPFCGLPMTSKYLSSCIDLCWKMGVQERPLHLDSVAEMDDGLGKKFDTDKFRAYTHSGRKVAFVVWPALCLYEGGPMLAKGIAQGDSIDEKKNTEMHS